MDRDEGRQGVGQVLSLTRYPMGDFLLLENFSISSQSPRVARALIFSHQYLEHQGNSSHSWQHTAAPTPS